MATHSSTLAWKIPWTEEPGRVQSMGSLGVRRNWATSLSLSLSASQLLKTSTCGLSICCSLVGWLTSLQHGDCRLVRLPIWLRAQIMSFSANNVEVVLSSWPTFRRFSSFPGGTVVKSTCHCRRHRKCRFDSWVRENPPENKMATHSGYFCLENPMARGAWWATVHRSKRVVCNWVTEHTQKFPGTTSAATYWSIICNL